MTDRSIDRDVCLVSLRLDLTSEWLHKQQMKAFIAFLSEKFCNKMTQVAKAVGSEVCIDDLISASR